MASDSSTTQVGQVVRGSTERRYHVRPEDNDEEHYKEELRNHWYALIESQKLKNRPQAIKRLNEDLVLWRDSAGKPRLFRDLCPHRGAQLSLGRVDGDTLQCWYHGWCFDSEGQCIGIPARGGPCKLASVVRVRSYPCEESGGLIFGYLSDDGRTPHEPCPRPFECEDPQWSGFVISYCWEGVNWLRAMDNHTDPLHGTFLHAGTITLGRGRRENVQMTLEERPYGFYVARKGAGMVPVDIDAIECHYPNWVRLDVSYPWTAGPGGPMRILAFITPVDDHTTQVYNLRLRHITGWKWWLWWTLWHVHLKRRMFYLLAQDEAILKSQRGLSSRADESLDQCDAGTVRMRKMLAEDWRKQQKQRTVAQV